MDWDIDEVELVLQTLVYDGRLEVVPSSVLQFLTSQNQNHIQAQYSNRRVYKVAMESSSINYLTESPCGMCPVASQCYDDGMISPKNCVYLTQWLGVPLEENERNVRRKMTTGTDIEDL